MQKYYDLCLKEQVQNLLIKQNNANEIKQHHFKQKSPNMTQDHTYACPLFAFSRRYSQCHQTNSSEAFCFPQLPPRRSLERKKKTQFKMRLPRNHERSRILTTDGKQVA